MISSTGTVLKKRLGRALTAVLLLQLAFGSLLSAAFADGGAARDMLVNAGPPLPHLTTEQVQDALGAAAKPSADLPAASLRTVAPAPETQQAPASTAVPLSARAGAEAAPSAVADSISRDAAGQEQRSEVEASGSASGSETDLADLRNGQDAASLSESTAESNEPMFARPASVLSSDRPGSVLALAAGPIVIDNDEAEEAEVTIAYEDLPTDEAGTKVKAGARFPVVITSEISSKSAKKGDPIQARLKYDLKIGDRVVAKKGAVVVGHINYSLKARTILHSLVSPERWYRNSGCLGIAFDEIITDQGEHLPLMAQPARKSRIVKNKGEGRVLGVNHAGQVTGPWSQQLRYKAIRIGLNAALSPAGVFSFGAMPVALGVIGAVNPSFAFSKPVGLNVRHRRLKGFAWGFLSGIPGSWLIEDTVVKGQEAVIKPGDEFLAEFREEFTGEASTDAMLLPGASTKVRGQVVDDGKGANKKK